MGTVTNDGLEIHWREHGNRSGVPLLFIHGLFWSTYQFDRYANLLSDRWVIAVDTRGHGASTRPTEAEAYSWESMSSDVLAVLDALDVPKAVLGGMSLGANVSLTAALSNPDRVAGLIVEMPVLAASEEMARRVFGLVGSVFGRLAGLTDRLPSLPLPRLAGQVPELRAFADFLAVEPAAAAALIRGLAAAPPMDYGPHVWETIAMPALVTGHYLDPVHRLDDAMELARSVPQASLVVMNTVWDFFLRPSLHAAAIQEFLGTYQL